MFKKTVSVFLAAVMLLFVCAATAEGGITVTDMAGRTVTLAAPAARIVALMPSDCEDLFAIGAGEAVVGCGTFCNYPAEVSEIAKVGSGNEMNVEQILALEPDLVVMTKMGHTEEQVAALEEKGLPVLVTDAQTIADTYECLKLLGQVTGREAEAEAVAAGMRERLEAVAAKVQESGLTVYFETTPMEFGFGLWSAGKGNFMDEIGTLCGLKNIFGDVEEAWPMVSEEDVIAADPDFIVTIDSNGMGDADAAKVVLAREGWQAMKAVQNGRVLLVINDEFTRPGPRLADAAEELYRLVYEAETVKPAA